MFKLNELKAPTGSTHSKKRKGKGMGSGLGKTAGKGHKGQKARGGGKVHPAFEGGQMPLQRRLPKIGFNSGVVHHQVTVNITELAVYAGKDMGLKDLLPKSDRSNPRARLSVIGVRLPKAFPKSIEAHKVTPKAKALLEENSVTVKIVEYKDGRLGKGIKKTSRAATSEAAK